MASKLLIGIALLSAFSCYGQGDTIKEKLFGNRGANRIIDHGRMYYLIVYYLHAFYHFFSLSISLQR